MQIPKLESFSLDLSLQIGGPPTGWIRPADVFCLARVGFLKNRITCQHSLRGIYCTKIWISGFPGTTALPSHSPPAFLCKDSEPQTRGHRPWRCGQCCRLTTVLTAPYRLALDLPCSPTVLGAVARTEARQRLHRVSVERLADSWEVTKRTVLTHRGGTLVAEGRV